MKNSKTTTIIGKVFIGLCMFSLGYVSILSLISPQATMDLVGTPLPNNDALSSIRGVYGGVGVSIVLLLGYLFKNNVSKGLQFLGIFWALYAVSRIITILVDGPLGDFGTQWLTIEIVFSIISFVMFYFTSKTTSES